MADQGKREYLYKLAESLEMLDESALDEIIDLCRERNRVLEALSRQENSSKVNRTA